VELSSASSGSPSLTAERFYREGEYSDLNPDDGDWDAPYKAKEIVRILERNHVQPSSICDVGCGVGRVLSEMARALPAVDRFVGYDIRPEVATRWRSYTDARLSFRIAESLDPDERFDLAMAIDVVEHIEDQFEFLRRLRPHGRYFAFHFPLDLSAQTVARDRLVAVRRQVGHLHWYTKSLALATLADAGYSVVDSAYTMAGARLPSRTVATRMAKLPRRLLFSANADLAARTVGGASLMVLAR
jgi:SAM-dependent methyltransferase